MRTCVSQAPTKPLLIYDGDCNFCKIWVRRWRHTTGDAVEYLPLQGEAIARQFPEIQRERLEAAVHLVLPDGSVYSGAEAAIRALAQNPNEQWLLDWYVHSPLFARTSERAYRFIASHRRTFSLLTRLAWGEHVEPQSHYLIRNIFVRGLAATYLCAFVSLWSQIIGLVGSNGILPAKGTMESVARQAEAAAMGVERFHVFPTLCWFSATDTSLNVQCAAGVVLAISVLLGVAPAPCLLLLWIIYLSLSTVCREFLGFQWDNLLLEIGFLGILFAPLQLLPRSWNVAVPSRIVLGLIRLLLFRLMLESGCVKLLSGDKTWKDLTALTYHYETQPWPTWLGWYAHQLPLWFQKASTLTMFGIELAVPFLIFAPRRLRQAGCLLLAALQVMILLTGNYGFFNLLTLLLCVTLLDDVAIRNILGRLRLKAKTSQYLPQMAQPTVNGRRRWRWPVWVTAPVACIIMILSILQIAAMFERGIPWPKPLRALYSWLGPFRTFNSYGLFAVMTTSRPEIIVEGSADGTNWLAYEFRYKAGDVSRRPSFLPGHMPRLDWQMWFAALGDVRQNPWFVNFCVRLMEGAPQATALLKANPFPTGPPRYIRARVYDYHFTSVAERRKTGAWWRRELKGEYLPAVSMRSAQ